MPRPEKKYRFKINGTSLQVWSSGTYGGSVGLEELYLWILKRRRKGTSDVLVQEEYINNMVEKGRNGTTDESTLER